jgi:hypothetical protein
MKWVALAAFPTSHGPLVAAPLPALPLVPQFPILRLLMNNWASLLLQISFMAW